MPRDAASTGATILLIEDDPGIADLIRDVLEASGYRVWWAEGGTAGQALFDQARPDLVILDLRLPDADGLALCAALRKRSDVPIIVCSGTPLKQDTLLAFERGADDFIPKPFVVDELRVRVEAVLRRTGYREAQHTPGPAAQPAPQRPRVDRIGELTIDHTRHRTHLGAREIALTATEHHLLQALVSRPDEVLSRRELAQVVWGSEEASIGRSIDVHVHRLRAKLRQAQEETGLPAPRVVAIRGFGYKLVRPSPQSNTPAPADA